MSQQSSLHLSLKVFLANLDLDKFSLPTLCFQQFLNAQFTMNSNHFQMKNRGLQNKLSLLLALLWKIIKSLVNREYNVFQKSKEKMRNTIYLALLLALVEILSAQNFMLSLNNSLLLHQNLSGIKALNKDFEGNFYVGFENGEARKYSATLSSYTSVSVPEPVFQFNFRRTYISTTIPGSGSVSVADSKMIVKTNNFTTIRDYNYDTGIEEEVFDLNSTYLNEMGFPILLNGVSYTFHVLICNDSILVAYRNVVQVASNFSTEFGAGTTCKASVQSTFPFGASGNSLTANFVFFTSFSNCQVYRTNVNLIFTYNSTIQHFDLTSNTVTYTLIYTSPSMVTTLLISNGLLMMQSNSTGVSSIYSVSNGAMGITSGIPLNQTFNFFYIYNAYYVLQSTGLVKLTFSSGSTNLTFNSLMTSLPYNTYRLCFGTSMNAFYIPGKPSIYYGGPCPNQATYTEGTCVSYNCTVGNCSSCGIQASLCSTCNTGYLLTSSNTCIFDNTTISNNSSSNITSNNSSANITNNNSSTNITSNNTNDATSSDMNGIATDLSYNFDASLMEFLSYFINWLKILISIPTARRIISPVFYYFGIFDDIYLYQFHDRIYGQTMNNTFYTLNDIQSSKWSMLNYFKVLSFVDVNITDFHIKTDFQYEYESFPFTDENHTDVGQEGLWSNCQNFFIVALPITITGFFFFKILFHFLFNHSISLWLRKFNYWPFLILLLFDGNIQQFSFYQATDWKNMFFFNLQNKFIKIQTVLFGFVIVLISISLYFVSYSFYQKRNKHMMDNNKNIFIGQQSLILQIGARNCFLGIMHSLLRRLNYEYMLSVLLGSQVIFLSFFIVSLSWGTYKRALKMWIYIILNLLKIVLILTLFVDYGDVNTLLIQRSQQILIFLEIAIFLIGVLIETYVTAKEIIETVIRMCVQQRKEKERLEKMQYLKKALSYSGAVVFVQNFQQTTTPKLKKVPKIFKLRKSQTIDILACQPESRFPLKKNYRINTGNKKFNLQIRYEERSPQLEE